VSINTGVEALIYNHLNISDHKKFNSVGTYIKVFIFIKFEFEFKCKHVYHIAIKYINTTILLFNTI